MKIGIAGPISIDVLNSDLGNDVDLWIYKFPLMSHLANELVKKGHHVIIYTYARELDKPVVLKDENFTICIGRREPHSGRDIFKSERKDLVEMIKKQPADIINAQWSYEFAMAALASGIPTVVTIRDHAKTILKYHADMYRLVRFMMNFYVIKRAKHLVANSDYLFDLLPSREQKKTRVINNFYIKALEKHYSEKNLKSHYIISVANGFGQRKNITTALKAFALVRAKFPDLEYFLVGAGMKEGGPAQSYALKEGLSDGVRFIGGKKFNEVVDMVKKAKVFLHSSLEESFGNAVLESMVVGTPVVAGKFSGNIPSLLDNGNVGILCDVRSVDEMAESILKVLENNEYAMQLKMKAFKFAKENFSIDRVIPKLLSYYDDILKNSNQGK